MSIFQLRAECMNTRSDCMQDAAFRSWPLARLLKDPLYLSPPIKKGSRRILFHHTLRSRLSFRSLGGSNVLDGQLDTAAVVHVQYQHFHFLTFFQDVSHFLYASIAQHGDVNQAVFARQDVHECAEVDYALNLADVDLADLSFSGDAQNALTRRFCRFLGLAEDLDRTVVFDVDRRFGFFTDCADGCATLPITSRILSVSIFIAIMVGALADSSLRD